MMATVRMDRGDRIFGVVSMTLAMLLGLVGVMMTVVGWSDVPSVMGYFWLGAGPTVALGGVGVTIWIGRSVWVGEWR